MAKIRTNKDILKAIKQIVLNIDENLSSDHLENRTSIFMNKPSEKKFDEYTAQKIKENFLFWSDSWIKPELRKVIKILTNHLEQ